MKVDVVVERTGHHWSAYAPDVGDVVVATGATREEAVERFREAWQELLEYKRGAGRPLPGVTAFEVREAKAA